MGELMGKLIQQNKVKTWRSAGTLIPLTSMGITM